LANAAAAQAIPQAAGYTGEVVGAATPQDLSFLKAELQALQVLVLLSPQLAMESQEQIATLRARVTTALQSGVSLDRAPIDHSESARGATSDVHVTGSALPAKFQASSDEARIARAEELLRLGDLAGARLVLEHAVRGGSAIAAFKLAETYDRRRLAAWRVVGIRGDEQKANELYKQAHAGGVQNARSRFSTLQD
jgi:hypothetical protein